MTSEQYANCKVIDALINRKQSFAIYRAPGERNPHFLTQTQGAVRLIYNIEELNGQHGFVIAPFQVSAHYPIVLIQPECIELSKPHSSKVAKPTDKNEKPSPSEYQQQLEEYAHSFDLFIKVLHEDVFDKLVLSRSLTIDRTPAFSPAGAFYRASQRYINSYVYLCYTPQTGVWLGSSPEILLSGEKGEWSTTALAGTQSLQQGELPINWDEKNKEEQKLVSAYIRKQLLSLNIRPGEKGPYAIRAGELAHLKTDFHFSLPDHNKLGDMLSLLHPTPAVCGLPKEEAYCFILENEGYERRYYSGFIGWLSPEGKTDLYVNLRCMNINDATLTLYAGGGLLPSSELNDEWNETENKLQTMLAITNN
ncbi:isochorismate synthase [uncultured Bacteroides sp.]|uniref:isochorismate synthase n=1 Tax=uncultured Bacteroides sp. TaxID=162156 RepID=UPI002AA61F64|nr:isochorismate synthase [uncultured Bacteroides sp.]